MIFSHLKRGRGNARVNFRKIRLGAAFLFIGLSLSLFSAHAADPYAPIQPFLEKYCVECHGEAKQKGEVRLDNFETIDGSLWSEVYDQVFHADMPPEDESQPSEVEREKLSELILQISRDDAYSIATGYRRLNRREYSNTVRDLLGLKPGLYDPATRIFEDEIDDGFDTNAAELVISNELLLEYLDSAERSLRMALFLEKLERPAAESVEFNPAKIHGGDNRFTTNKSKSTVLRGSGGAFANEDTRKVEIAGNYRITITAAGVDRDNYGKMKFPPAKGPIQMGVGIRLDGDRGRRSETTELIKTFDLLDDEFKSYETEVWLEPGAYPYISFTNGAGKPASSVRQAIRRKMVDPDTVAPKNYNGPGVEITKFKVEGPLDPEWPPASYQTIFQASAIPDFSSAEVRSALIERFVTRAFRRPATETDIEDYRNYLDQQYAKVGDWHEAFIKTFAAIMSSHDFLYIKEEVGKLPPFDLVNRLSYFLWSTMPDSELSRLAASGDILDPEVYSAQVDRLLKDPRADEFVRGFATQWLSLNLLGTMPPDIKDRRYSAYLKKGYEAAFRSETLHFFRHVLFENQPLGDFLDSDYTFINDTLADVYELPFKGDSTFQRVTLSKDSDRGGLVGHGSIHALTSNGVETLPVTRGHWVMDELLGDPPPPPPEEVPALVPDLNGLDTPRAQLARHREDAACFECHKGMDPFGLALENFDVIGRYRAKYEAGGEIDPAGEVFGTAFKNIPQLRQILRSHENEFARSLTSKLAEYAKGRKLNRRDFDVVDQIVAKAKEDDYRFQSLLRRFLMSDLVRNR